MKKHKREKIESEKQEDVYLVTARLSDATLQWKLNDWSTMLVMSMASVDPFTAEDLAVSLRRYQPDRDHLATSQPVEWSSVCREIGARSAGEAGKDGSGPWCMIDFVGRTLVAGGGCLLPDPYQAYVPGEGDSFEGFPIVWFSVSKGWKFSEEFAGWEQLMAARFAEANAVQPFDARAILFGRPLLEHILDSALRTVENKAGQWSEDPDRVFRHTRRIHADWLMTPRADLQGYAPREILVGDRERIDRDREHRAEQWSRQGSPPTPLAENCRAYEFGWMGTTECVLYFGLVRALIDRAWELAVAAAAGRETMDHDVWTRDVWAPGLEALERARDAWMDAPVDGMTRSAKQLIALERSRTPIVNEADDFDCDCPLCLAMATSDSVSFTWFDGVELELEDRFAFSLAETREEWEFRYSGEPEEDDFADDDLQPGALSVDEGCDEADEEVQGERPRANGLIRSEADRRLGGSQGDDTAAMVAINVGEVVSRSSDQEGRRPEERQLGDRSGSVWKQSFVDWENMSDANGASELPRLGIGFHLAELVSHLKELPLGRASLPELNAAYLRFHRAVGSAELGSAAKELADKLEAISQKHPSLTPQCADLQSRLDEVLRMPPA